MSENLYAGTKFEMVLANELLADSREYALGIVDEIAGERFGWYADCGIVYKGDEQ